MKFKEFECERGFKIPSKNSDFAAKESEECVSRSVRLQTGKSAYEEAGLHTAPDQEDEGTETSQTTRDHWRPNRTTGYHWRPNWTTEDKEGQT